jgi:hypothetical protein
MSHIFISYSHKDKDYVHKLQEALQEQGFEVWIDDRIHYGSEWPKVVTRNLDVSDGVIVVLSNNSYESDMVQNEVARAREKKKPIFPLLLDGENWLIVQAKQFVDIRNGSLPTEKFYKRLEEITPRKNEKAAREAAENAAMEKAKREAAEKAEREKAEKAAREKLEHEVAEKARKEEAERDAAEKAKGERAERFAAQTALLKETLSKSLDKVRLSVSKARPFLRLGGMIGIIFVLLWVGSWAMPKFISLIPTAKASATPSLTATITRTYSPVPPTETVKPNATPTKTRTATPAPKSFTAISVTQVESMIIHPDLACNWAGIGGTIVDANNSPVIGTVVLLRGTLNGRTIEQQTVSGINKEYGPSGFEFVLANAPVASNNTLYIQLVDVQNTPRSDQVFVTTSSECTKNLVILQFKENR